MEIAARIMVAKLIETVADLSRHLFFELAQRVIVGNRGTVGAGKRGLFADKVGQCNAVGKQLALHAHGV